MESVFFQQKGTHINKEQFSRTILETGGIEMSELSIQDIEDLYDENYHGDLSEVCWAFSETLLGGYPFIEPDDICEGVFKLIILCQASGKAKRIHEYFDEIVFYAFWTYYRKLEKKMSMQLFHLCSFDTCCNHFVSDEEDITLDSFMKHVYQDLSRNMNLVEADCAAAATNVSPETPKPIAKTEVKSFSSSIIHDGVSGMSGISPQTVKQLYEGSFRGDWKMILHSCSKALETYQLADSVDELCCGMFTLVILCQICIPDETLFYEHFNQIIDMYYCFCEKIDSLAARRLFRLCLVEREILKMNEWQCNH